MLRSLPLAVYRPLRLAVRDLSRRHPARLAATLILRRALRAHRHHLAARIAEIRPLDFPHLSFAAVDSMVMDAVFWFGVRGYEGIVARVWTALCRQSRAILEIGGNVGLFTVIGASATEGAYTVVEPVPAVAATLRANLARNGLGRVELLEAAVVPGEVTHQVTLSIPDEGRANPVGAHLVDGVEVSGRDRARLVDVVGLPIRRLAEGRDLIKLDAEGIEAVLLGDIRDLLVARRPTLLVEVLPEARLLGALLAALAAEAGYRIHVLPEYGADEPVEVAPGAFSSDIPGRHRSKDVVLIAGELPRLR